MGNSFFRSPPRTPPARLSACAANRALAGAAGLLRAARVVSLGVVLIPSAMSFTTVAAERDFRGHQFLGYDSLERFTRSAGARTNEVVLASPRIAAGLDWDELIASWNAEMPGGSWLTVEARARYPDRMTKFYVMGRWSADTNQHPRESVLRQKDADGDVATDTLTLKQPCRDLELRVTLGGEAGRLPRIKFLGLCLTDSRARPPELPPNRAAWGRLMDVPERSQMLYPGGDVWCSPTTVSMLLAHWGRVLGRPDLDFSVPQVVREVFDPNWEGTGNWVFNTAFAGSLPGMRACVARLSDVAELEDWIAAGLPVGLSLCYNQLRGREGKVSGHLVVCVGFTEDGDPIINDPGTRENVRKTFPRKNLMAAWATSKNAAYLVYPEGAKLPVDRFGHWSMPSP